MWRSERLLFKYRSASDAEHPWRIRFVLQPELSFSSGNLNFRLQFTINGHAGQALLYAQDVVSLFQISDVFAHSSGELLAFSFLRSSADPTQLQTIRHTDRATWRQVFDIRDMNNNVISNRARMHSDLFVPPQTVVFPDAQNLDDAPVSLSETESALIAFDTFSHDDPNKVYRCVYAISIEPNPPSIVYDSSESESHESKALLSPGETELDPGNTEGDDDDDHEDDHLPGSDEQGLDHVGTIRSDHTPHQEEDSDDEVSWVDFGENHQMESFPYEDYAHHSHESAAFDEEAIDGDSHSLEPHSQSIGVYNETPPAGSQSTVASSSSTHGSLDAGPSLPSYPSVPAAVASSSGTPFVPPPMPAPLPMQAPLPPPPMPAPLPPPPMAAPLPPPMPAASSGHNGGPNAVIEPSLQGFVPKKRNLPPSARHRQCDRNEFCTFQRGHGGFCNKQGRCPVKYCSQARDHDGPCDRKLHPAYDPKFDDDDDF